jgi:hypothetical protein
MSKEYEDYKYGADLKNRALGEAVRLLWDIHDDLCDVFRELEDEERVLRKIGTKLNGLMGGVKDVACCIEYADRFIERQRRKATK